MTLDESTARDERIENAVRRAVSRVGGHPTDAFLSNMTHSLRSVVVEAVAEERAACAALADAEAMAAEDYRQAFEVDLGWSDCAERLAASIRARGT